MFANRITQLTFFVVCVLGIQGKPSLSFHFPAIGRVFGQNRYGFASVISGGSSNSGATMPPIKAYSGKREKNDSIRMVYFHDQTVAIVELEPDKLLLSCELIEIYEPNDAIKVLGEFQEFARPVGISFKEMTTLMNQCEQLEDAKTTHTELTKNVTQHSAIGRGLLSKNPFVLLSGIIPGTKWCGTGDIAHDYYDLGAEPQVDKCCRAHDLCPVKVRAYSHRYNLTNESLYTKSHCLCDDHLFTCLKSNETPTAQIMGNIYFNLVQVPCVEDTSNGKKFRKARNHF